jgi:hypothetical protein
METAKRKFFLLVICLLGAMNIFANPNPPQPPKGDQPTGGTPPPGLPIDTEIYLLFILAILYGIYILYNHSLKVKTPS